MDLLPLEALNIIAENQTLYELSASSTVNPYCNADMAEYLKTAECRVYPRFESPELEESTETSLYKKAGDNEISIRGSLHIVARTQQSTWRLRSEGWSRVLSLRKNRTLYVLAASSAVSVGRRGSFNQNWMWWQNCIADTAEYLETAE
ncbi:hypothetical protein J6590_083196 [Homalodisca vitripennis]|nr:hypothetical protein J6590_083196 [Homalodisca vitripennis]